MTLLRQFYLIALTAFARGYIEPSFFCISAPKITSQVGPKTLPIGKMKLLLLFSLFCVLFAAGKAAKQEYDSHPAILLVPGAFHQPSIYHEVVQLLKHAGYDDRVEAIGLPSVGSLAGRDADVNVVVAAMKKHFDRGRDVVLVGNSVSPHSPKTIPSGSATTANHLPGYGCTVIGDAVKGFLSATNTPPYDANGQRLGRVVSLIYFAGYIPYIADVEQPETHKDVRLVSPTWFAFWPNDSLQTTPKTVRWDGDLASFPPEKTFCTYNLDLSFLPSDHIYTY